jgi:hypothetical protein
LKRVFAPVLGVLIGGIAGNIMGWIWGFLFFGDGSRLYLFLRRIVPEPYGLIIGGFTIAGAVVGGIVSFSLTSGENGVSR